MKILAAEEYEVVKAGREFRAPEPLDVPAMLLVMEKNESYIYWLQQPPAEVTAQVAAVKINGVLYALNMRLEKAIFRHVRLTKNFTNVEVLPDGTRKLRIPLRLFNEKLRTSNRFEVVQRVCLYVQSARRLILTPVCLQVMQASATKKARQTAKRVDGARVLKRKKRNSLVHFSADEIAYIFSVGPGPHTACTLLSSPDGFLRQMHRTFVGEFPGYLPGPEVVAAIVAGV